MDPCTLSRIITLLSDPAWHFLYAFLLAALQVGLMWIMSFVLFKKVPHLRRFKDSWAVGFITGFCLGLVVLVSVSLSHYGVDYWLTLPLAPHLIPAGG
jgi:hypothetical protein